MARRGSMPRSNLTGRPRQGPLVPGLGWAWGTGVPNAGAVGWRAASWVGKLHSVEFMGGVFVTSRWM